MVILACAVLGVGLTIAGSLALRAELIRKPTQSEIDAAVQVERASRWRTRPAEQIFPAMLKDFRGSAYATLLGIAPEDTCASALDEQAVKALEKYGCRTVLRATYADRTETRLTTVAIVVLRDANAPIGKAGWTKAGAHPAAIPDTIAEDFSDGHVQQRAYDLRGHYLVLTTRGYADGRPTLKPGQFEDAPDSGEANDIAKILQADGPVCEVVQC